MSNVKTSKKAIYDYWHAREDECGMGTDWDEGLERCWRCGYRCGERRRRLERCHIIPAALGGEDIPSNFVLLCRACHDEAPNCSDPNAIWEWIRATSYPFYDNFWTVRRSEIAQKQFERQHGIDLSKSLMRMNLKDLSRELKTLVWNHTSPHWGVGITTGTLAWLDSQLIEMAKDGRIRTDERSLEDKWEDMVEVLKSIRDDAFDSDEHDKPRYEVMQLFFPFNRSAEDSAPI